MRRRMSVTIVAVLVLAVAASACTPPAPATEKVLDPKIVKSWNVDYWIASDSARTAMSPDSKYVLLVQAGPEERVVAAVHLAKDDAKEIQLYRVDNSYLQSSKSLDFLTVGWTSETKCVFIAAGDQNEGPNQGKRGVSILEGDTASGKSQEFAFIPLEQGHVRRMNYDSATGKLHLDITGAIWVVDTKGKTARLVKDGLPTYDGLFYSRLSPDASAYVYELHEEEGQHGIYLLDTATGVQKPLALNGDTLSFYPSWSPDGQYLAMYNVERLPGKTGTTWMKYGIYPGEDGPKPIATGIVVMDRSGRTVNTISLEDKVLGLFKWSHDSKSLAFAVGPAPEHTVDPEVDWVVPEITWESVYTAKALEAGQPSKVADVGSGSHGSDLFVEPIAFDRQNRGVYYQVSLVTGETAIWYGASGKTPVQSQEGQPVKVADGNWQVYPEIPAFGDTLAAVIGAPSEKTGLWLLNSGEIKKVDEWPGNYTMVVGFNQDTLVTCEMKGESDNTVTVRSMYSERTVTK
ncbi:MAG: hypothetical protein ACM3WU_10530 [Bacillota bacterium]